MDGNVVISLNEVMLFVLAIFGIVFFIIASVAIVVYVFVSVRSLRKDSGIFQAGYGEEGGVDGLLQAPMMDEAVSEAELKARADYDEAMKIVDKQVERAIARMVRKPGGGVHQAKAPGVTDE